MAGGRKITVRVSGELYDALQEFQGRSGLPRLTDAVRLALLGGLSSVSSMSSLSSVSDNDDNDDNDDSVNPSISTSKSDEIGTVQSTPERKTISTNPEGVGSTPDPERSAAQYLFEEAWALYPKRVNEQGNAYKTGKAKARVFFLGMPADRQPLVVASARNYAEHKRREARVPNYVPDMHRWLAQSGRGDKWEDWIDWRPEEPAGTDTQGFLERWNGLRASR